MVQAAQLMKKLQNVSMIFMLPKNLLGESTTELCTLYFLFYSDLTSVGEVSSCIHTELDKGGKFLKKL